MPCRRLSLFFLLSALFAGQAAAYIRLPSNLSPNTRNARIARSQERLARRQSSGSETVSAWAPATTKYQTYNITTDFGTEIWQCTTVLTPTTSSSGEMAYEEDQSCTFTLIEDPGLDTSTLPPPVVPPGVLTPVDGPTIISTQAAMTSSSAAGAAATPDPAAGAGQGVFTSVDPAGDSTFLIPPQMTSALAGTPSMGSSSAQATTSPAANMAPSPASGSAMGGAQAGNEGADIIGTSSIPVSAVTPASAASPAGVTPSANPTAQLSSMLLPSSASSSADPNASAGASSADPASQLASILFGSSSSSSGSSNPTALAASSSPSASAGVNSGALQSANDTTTTNAAVTIPGQSIQVLPIGLGVFAGVMVIVLIVVGVVTFERTQYRKAFRARKMAEQGSAMGYGGMAERA